MNPLVRTMLENMYDKLDRRFRDSSKAWDSLIEFLAVDHCAPLLYQLNHKFEWLHGDSRLAQSVMAAYDPKLLKSDYYDHLGEMYLEHILSKSEAARRGIFLTPSEVAQMMASMTIQSTNQQVNVLDPAVGTGRLLMAAHRQVPNARLFGVDTDLRSLRICFTNCAIHDITAYLLHADSLQHEIDIAKEDGRHNWQYSNRWYSCMDKLTQVISDPNHNLPLNTNPRK